MKGNYKKSLKFTDQLQLECLLNQGCLDQCYTSCPGLDFGLCFADRIFNHLCGILPAYTFVVR